ncbi:MAG: Trk family potassium uptake protein [Lachnospiraceae bacterium]|nr:Trk family potassium uptake protein [Lachnospiraceae bacterium]
MLPVSTKDGLGASFFDALFTATSAVCVTGLIVQDTATYWSGFGQGVILSLIQTGGMGIVTLGVSLALFSGRKIGLKQRSTMQEAIGAPKVGGIVKLTGFLLKVTVLTELAGAAVMAPVFCKELGIAKGIWYSLFHSVSAFCNAGFDLMGYRERFSSLVYFVSEPSINLAIMGLIVAGGLGFLTWKDIVVHKIHIRRYSMQSKVILVTTSLLILFPAVFFFFFEFQDRPLQERILSSLFQSVTPRTAGFNTVDLTAMSEPGQGIMTILMLIGGAPGSTAGGMKITTLAVMLSTALTVFCKKENPQFFGRRITDEAVRNAGTILTMYLILFLVGGFAISCLENLPLVVCLYEAASAVGTVGLTLGITPELGVASRMILILLMYLGRVGGLTFVFAALSGRHNAPARLPEERIAVG